MDRQLIHTASILNPLPGRIFGIRLIFHSGHSKDLADLPDQLLGLDEARLIAHLETDTHRHTGFFALPDNFLGLVDLHGDGLLAEHGNPALQQIHDDLVMGAGRGDHTDQIQLFRAVINAPVGPAAELGGQLFCSLQVEVNQSRQFRIGNFGISVCVKAANAATADNTNFHHQLRLLLRYITRWMYRTHAGTPVSASSS